MRSHRTAHPAESKYLRPAGTGRRHSRHDARRGAVTPSRALRTHSRHGPSWATRGRPVRCNGNTPPHTTHGTTNPPGGHMGQWAFRCGASWLRRAYESGYPDECYVTIITYDREEQPDEFGRRPGDKLLEIVLGADNAVAYVKELNELEELTDPPEVTT